MVVERTNLTGYDAGRKGAVYYRNSDAGCLRLEGPDRIDFLQRQSTNDIRLLTDSRAVRSVLTSPLARIIDVLWLISRNDGIDILTLPDKGASTAHFFKRHIFFM